MHHLTTVQQTCVELTWDRPLQGSPAARATQLRGALACAFPDNDLFHQHDADGKPLYRHPYIHYRWHEGRGLVVGWRTAAPLLLDVPWLDLPLTLGKESVYVSDALLSAGELPVGISDRLMRYHLVSPVLLFNQRNYRHYRTLNEVEQRAERDRLLVAQLLTTLRGLGIEFPVQLYAAFSEARSRVCRLKGQELIGIEGEILCSAVLPSGLAIGHGVSHGYGWLVGLDDSFPGPSL